MECQICCETFNKQQRKKVTCPFCDYELCRACVQHYLLTSSNDPHCMNCKNVWNREFVDGSCTKTFCNKQLKEHRENVLLEREKSYLPETQEYAKREKQRRQIIVLMRTAREEIEKQRDLIRTLEGNLDVLSRGQSLEEGGETKKVFIRKCPLEGCKGFLSSQWKCELCEKKICSKCNECKEDENHECKEENVKTAELLRKDTKPCPKCGTLIHKSSGCNQMWCTSCHTAFNWTTGRIESGIIHNPHFYEFQRRSGGGGQANRNLGDIPCGGLPSIGELNTFFGKAAPARHQRRYYGWQRQEEQPDNVTEDEDIVYKVHRLISHFENYEFRYNLREELLTTNNRDLRVRFLLDEISEEDLKINIQKREKKVYRQRELLQILRMFTLTASDMLRQLILKEINLKLFCSNITNLKFYTNEQLNILSKRYNCKCYIIDNRWSYE